MKPKPHGNTLKNLSLNNTAKIKKLLSTPFKVLSHNKGELALFLFSVDQADLPEELLDQKIKQFSSQSRVPQDTIRQLLKQQIEVNQINDFTQKLVNGEKIRPLPTPKTGKRKYTKRTNKTTDSQITEENSADLEDVFIDDEICMMIPKNQVTKPSMLIQVKSEPVECFEEESTNILNDIESNEFDIVQIISNAKSYPQIKREPALESTELNSDQNSRSVWLQRLLLGSNLDQHLQLGGLTQIYTLFKEIISSPDPHTELNLLFKVLEKANLTVDMLKETKIGKLVNLVRLEQRFDKEVRLQAQSLVNKWKEMVQLYKRSSHPNPSSNQLPYTHMQLHASTQQTNLKSQISTNRGTEQPNFSSVFMAEADEKKKAERRKKMLDLLTQIEKSCDGTTSRLQSILKSGEKKPQQKSVRFPVEDSSLVKVSYFDNSQDYNVDDSVESDESDKTDKNEDVEMEAPSTKVQVKKNMFLQVQLQNALDAMKPLQNYVGLSKILEIQRQSNKIKLKQKEHQTQVQRERFASPVKQLLQNDEPTHRTEPPTDLQAQFEIDLNKFHIELKRQQERQQRTDQIVVKLVQLLKEESSTTAAATIVENKEIFIQILNALDQPTVEFLFCAPEQLQEDTKECLMLQESEKILIECQRLMFKLVATHYLNCNPILGNYNKKIDSLHSYEEKNQFYKQAKDFFFISVQNPLVAKIEPQYQNKLVKTEALSQNGGANLLKQNGGTIKSDVIQQSIPTFVTNQQTQMKVQSPPEYIQSLHAPFQMGSMQIVQPVPHIHPQFPQATFVGVNQTTVDPFGLMPQLYHPMNSVAPPNSQVGAVVQQAPQQAISIQKPKNYKTVPCRMYHGPQGCSRSEQCHFIHDPLYQSVEIPREVLLRHRYENMQRYKTGQLSGIPQQQIQMPVHDIQSLVSSHPILASHPYFNPDFVAQYRIQDQQYKIQQQAQLVQNLTRDNTQVSQVSEGGGISKEVMGTTGLNNMIVENNNTQTTGADQQPVQNVDYQQKVLIDEETQEVHRKLLEQIKGNKERMKNRSSLQNPASVIQQHQQSQMLNYQQPRTSCQSVSTPKQSLRVLKSRSRSRSTDRGCAPDTSTDTNQKRRLVSDQRSSSGFKREHASDKHKHESVYAKQEFKSDQDRGKQSSRHVNQHRDASSSRDHKKNPDDERRRRRRSPSETYSEPPHRESRYRPVRNSESGRERNGGRQESSSRRVSESWTRDAYRQGSNERSSGISRRQREDDRNTAQQNRNSSVWMEKARDGKYKKS